MLTLSSMENLIAQCNLKAYIQNLVENGSMVSEKKASFNFFICKIEKVPREARIPPAGVS